MSLKQLIEEWAYAYLPPKLPMHPHDSLDEPSFFMRLAFDAGARKMHRWWAEKWLEITRPLPGDTSWAETVAIFKTARQPLFDELTREAETILNETTQQPKV